MEWNEWKNGWVFELKLVLLFLRFRSQNMASGSKITKAPGLFTKQIWLNARYKSCELTVCT